jgi:hypothetical protein
METVADSPTVHDVEILSTLIVSGAYCLACIARKTSMSAERVTAAFRRMEFDWEEPLIDMARCVGCRATTTVYLLRLP